MIDPVFSLPHPCFLRPACKGDRWTLQWLVLKMVWTEALDFDLRLIGYRLVRILLLGLAGNLQTAVLFQSRFFFVRGLLTITLFCTVLWAVISFILLCLYLLLIPTEPLFNWCNYWVIDHQGHPVACVAMSQYSDFCTIYHVFVEPDWRRQALASTLLQGMLNQARQPVYIVCKPKLVQFYSRLGFVSLGWKQLSPMLQFHFRDFAIDQQISGHHWEVMYSSPEKSTLR
jgi:GNAT superfamily N-acetyltransferase